jgi:hypothetical protein
MLPLVELPDPLAGLINQVEQGRLQLRPKKPEQLQRHVNVIGQLHQRFVKPLGYLAQNLQNLLAKMTQF